jgi:hypothetical protein
MRLAPCLLPVFFLLLGCGGHKSSPPSDRSWETGTIHFIIDYDGQEVPPVLKKRGQLGIYVDGSWPDASPDLWIWYSLSVTQPGSRDVFLEATSRGTRLSDFTGGHTGMANVTTCHSAGTSDCVDCLRRNLANPDQPFRAVFDYEIWKGEPGKGKLLVKNSVYSEPIELKNVK